MQSDDGSTLRQKPRGFDARSPGAEDQSFSACYFHVSLFVLFRMLCVFGGSRSIIAGNTKHTKHANGTNKNYLSFNVDKLSSANNTATIRNLKTIFGSFHPVISK